MNKRHITPICAALALLGAVTFAPSPSPAVEPLADGPVVFGPPYRLKIAKTLKFNVGCSARCDLSTRNVLHLPDRDLGPLVVDPAPLATGEYVYVTVGLNKAAKLKLAEHPGKARLKTTITATNLETGGRSIVHRSFKFKRR